MHNYEEGDRVAIVLDGSQQMGMPHRRFRWFCIHGNALNDSMIFDIPENQVQNLTLISWHSLDNFFVDKTQNNVYNVYTFWAIH